MIFEQLCSLWSVTARLAGDQALLVTETTLPETIKVTKNPPVEAQLNREQFSLLITSQFNALMVGKTMPTESDYQISICFAAKAIANYLNQFDQQSNQEYFQQNIIPRLVEQNNDIDKFIAQLLNILEENNSYRKLTDNNSSHNFSGDRSVEKILHNQVEQQRILNRVKIQISQRLDLLEIVQMTIEQVCRLLELDRLVIYQLDVPLKSVEANPTLVESIDSVVYEAKASQAIPSILYFQDEICLSKLTQCKNKYRSGFSLVVNDVDKFNFNPCLRALMHRLQVKAKLVVPIIVHGELWGFLIAHQCFAPRNWRNDEVSFFRQIAEYLAIAIYQKESYQQLQIQKEQLEKQVQAKAKQLRDALIAAQAASHTKQEFIGNMSHELRTPLTCIIGLSSTLLHWSLDNGHIPLPIEKQRQYLKTIQDNGRHLLSLVNSILEFSEIESGKYFLNVGKFSLYQLARGVLQIVQEEANNQQIELVLEFEVNPEEDDFCADQDRLEEILLNLLSNGIKFTAPGGTVILRIWREKQKAIFEIEDTGIGISQQQLPLLFEQFQQLESSRQRTHNGTGLGLALTKQLVELHRGSIEVESAVAKGSIFRVSIPNQTELKPKSNQSANINYQADTKNSTKSKTIVLLAQDEEIATLICQMLTAADYQVVWLIDSVAAIGQIKLLEPHLVIVEQEIAEINISQLTKELKQARPDKPNKIILLSEQLSNSEWQYFSSNGVDDLLLKSMEATQVLQKITALTRDALSKQI